MLKRLLSKPVRRVVAIALAVALVVSISVSQFLPARDISVRVGGLLSFEVEIGLSVNKAAITVSTLGTAQSKTASATVSVSIGSISVGDVIIAVVAADSAIALTEVEVRENGSYVDFDARDISLANPGQVWTGVFRRTVADADATSTVRILGDGIVARAFTAYKATGLDASPVDRTSQATGSGTTATSGSTATLSQADELIIGAIGVEDEVDDLSGTWTTGASYVSGNEQQTGTNGGGDSSNISIYSAAEIVSATTAQTATVTGLDNVDQANAIITYKMDLGAEADISNAPDSKAFGTVSPGTTYWSDGAEPSWPLVDADAFFTLTNNGGTCSVTILATNFTGGVGWTLGTPATNVVRLTAFEEGDGSGDGLVLTTSAQAFISGLSTNVDWELKMETPTIITDGVGKTSTITLTATLD